MAMRKLSRKKAHRTWLMRNLTTSVILYERVVTTSAKAKEVRRFVDQVINLGKNDTLANRRALHAWLPDNNATKKIVEVLAKRYTDRPSGYTRLTSLSPRVGDRAPRTMIELIDNPIDKIEAETTAPATETQAKTSRTPRLGKAKANVTVRRKGATK